MNNLQEYGQRLIEFLSDIIESLGETGIMMSFAVLAAIILGLPIGTILFLTNEDNPRENKLVYQVLYFIYHCLKKAVCMLGKFHPKIFLVEMNNLT